MRGSEDMTDERISAAQSGADSQDKEITLVAPAKEGGAFLKVGRK